MSKASDALRVFTDEWPMEASAVAEIEEWLAGKEGEGEDPMTWAEGMAVKCRTLKGDQGPAGFILWAIRNGKDDYTSFAPRQTFESSAVRKMCQEIASRSRYSYSELIDLHRMGCLSWPIVNIYSPSYVTRVFEVLREHAREMGFQGIRVSRRTPAFFEGEWIWTPEPTVAVVDAGGA